MRDAAAALGVPEAALVEARRSTGAARRLRRPDAPEGFGAILAGLPEAGEVMALTRNAACVHEKTGRFNPPDFQGAMGQVVGEIDLRLFTRQWRFGYLLDEDTRSGPRRSLQFFDASRHRHPQDLRNPRHRRRRVRPHRRRSHRPRRAARHLRAGPRRQRTRGRRDRRRGLPHRLGRAEAHPRVRPAPAPLRRHPRPGDAPRPRLRSPRERGRGPHASSSLPPLPRSRSWSSSATPAACRSTRGRSTASRLSALG